MIMQHFLDGLYFGLGFGMIYFVMEYYVPRLIKKVSRKRRKLKQSNKPKLKVLNGGQSSN